MNGTFQSWPTHVGGIIKFRITGKERLKVREVEGQRGGRLKSKM